MATRRSPVLSLLIVATGLALAAAAWWLLAPEPPVDDGPAPVTVEAPGPTAEAPTVPEPVDRGPAPAPAEPPPRREGTLIGRLVDTNRVPVTDARVSLFEGARNPLGLSRDLPALASPASVDEGGAFRFEGVPESTHVVLRALGDGFAPTEAGPHPVIAGQLTDLGAVVVAPGLDIGGVVLGERGARVPDARVRLSVGESTGWGEPDPAPLAETRTDAEGRFRFAHAPRSIVFLEAWAEGYGRTAVQQDVVVDAGQDHAEYTLQLQPAVPLVGRAVAADDGRALPGVEVRVVAGSERPGVAARATTDTEGRFVVPDLTPGQYQVMCDPRGFLPAKRRVDPSTFGDEQLLELSAASAIEGRVVDADGQAVGAFDLNVRRSNRNGVVGDTVGSPRRVRDPAGRFRVDDLEPGFHLLEVWAKGHAVSFSRAIQVRKGKDSTGVEVVLQRSATLAGVVVDDLGQGIAGAMISLGTNHAPTAAILRQGAERASWHQFTRTDDEGRFELRDASADDYQLEVDHRDYPVLWRNDVSIVAGERTELPPLVLPRPATVTGTVVGLDGQLLIGAKVSLGGGDNRNTSLETVTDGKGRYRFDRLEPGPYSIRCYSPGRNPLASMVSEIQRIKKDEEGRPVLAPDFALQAGQVLEHLVHADT